MNERELDALKEIARELKKLNGTVAKNVTDIAVIETRCAERSKVGDKEGRSITDLYEKYNALNGRVMRMMGAVGVALAAIQIVLKFI